MSDYSDTLDRDPPEIASRIRALIARQQAEGATP
jgi:hypothetical protein